MERPPWTKRNKKQSERERERGKERRMRGRRNGGGRNTGQNWMMFLASFLTQTWCFHYNIMSDDWSWSSLWFRHDSLNKLNRFGLLHWFVEFFIPTTFSLSSSRISNSNLNKQTFIISNKTLRNNKAFLKLSKYYERIWKKNILL